MDWTRLYHPSHTPADPVDTGAATGLILCTVCHCLLASDRGPAHNARVRVECEPTNSAGSPPRGTPASGGASHP